MQINSTMLVNRARLILLHTFHRKLLSKVDGRKMLKHSLEWNKVRLPVSMLEMKPISMRTGLTMGAEFRKRDSNLLRDNQLRLTRIHKHSERTLLNSLVIITPKLNPWNQVDLFSKEMLPGSMKLRLQLRERDHSSMARLSKNLRPQRVILCWMSRT